MKSIESGQIRFSMSAIHLPRVMTIGVIYGHIFRSPKVDQVWQSKLILSIMSSTDSVVKLQQSTHIKSPATPRCCHQPL